jgi:catechol 2,3-dioxygenase-like lactoylglutathione lyase family enzyme
VIAMRVTGFNHAAFNVHGKLEETIKFYVDVLQLPQEQRNALATRVAGAWFQVDERTQIHVADEIWAGERRSPIGPHVSLWVEDIVSARLELESLGVKVLAIGSGVEQVIWFSDPAGNTIELQQTRSSD